MAARVAGQQNIPSTSAEDCTARQNLSPSQNIVLSKRAEWSLVLQRRNDDGEQDEQTNPD